MEDPKLSQNNYTICYNIQSILEYFILKFTEITIFPKFSPGILLSSQISWSVEQKCYKKNTELTLSNYLCVIVWIC